VSTEHLDELSHDIIIPWDNIALLGIIGKGEFGVVYKGHLMSPLTKSKPKVVAVKTLKGDFDQEDVNDLMEESIKMRAFQHPNVLGLVGVSIDLDSVPYIVLPYMANGNLLEWLKRERGRIIISYETTNEDELMDVKRELLSACYQIAKGMEYLASRKFVHRDLAARNCMMDETNLLKVSDFGLSQCVSEKNYLRMTEVEDTKLPIKWMAIESISGAIFSEMSDVVSIN
jgi:serine/threonine protein kinase